MRVSLRTLFFAMVAISVGLWGADDPILGTWKLNVSKSKFASGHPPRSLMQRFERAGEGLKYIEDEVDEKGEHANLVYIANYDGKEVPLMTGSGEYVGRFIKLKKIDAYTTEITSRTPAASKTGRGGVIVGFRHVISKDGKTRTITLSNSARPGQPIEDTRVYEKQ